MNSLYLTLACLSVLSAAQRAPAGASAPIKVAAPIAASPSDPNAAPTAAPPRETAPQTAIAVKITAPATAPVAGATPTAAPPRAVAGAAAPVKQGCGTAEPAPAQPAFTDFPEGCTYDTTESADSKCSVACGKGTRPVKKTGGPATCPETFNLPCYDCVCPCVFKRTEWGVCRMSTKLSYRSTVIITPAGEDAVLTKCPPQSTEACLGCEVVDGKSTCPTQRTDGGEVAKIMTVEELAAVQKKQQEDTAAAAATLADLKKKCLDDFDSKGVWGDDCDCNWPENKWGCCADGKTAATGENNQGCCGYSKDPKTTVVGVCKILGHCGKTVQAEYTCSAASTREIKLADNGADAIFADQAYASRKLDMTAALVQDGDTAVTTGKMVFTMFAFKGIGGVKSSGYFSLGGLSEQGVPGGRVRFFDAPDDKPDSTDCKERGAEYATEYTQYNHASTYELIFGTKGTDASKYVWSKTKDTKILYTKKSLIKDDGTEIKEGWFKPTEFVGKRVVLEDNNGKAFLCGVIRAPGAKKEKKAGTTEFNTCYCDPLCSLRGVCCDNIDADCGYKVIDFNSLFG